MDAATITPLFVHNHSLYGDGWDLHPGSTPGGAGFFNNNAAVFCPITIPWPFPVRRLVAFCTTATGNMDIGIYTAGGSRIVSSGSFVTANGPNYVTLSPDIVLAPGSYYLALGASSNAGKFFSGGTTVTKQRAGGWLKQTASAFPLPATMSGVAVTEALAPMLGITQTASGF